eukprot:scaffold30357_cov116-Isochrysis_galbana.AAC.10
MPCNLSARSSWPPPPLPRSASRPVRVQLCTGSAVQTAMPPSGPPTPSAHARPGRCQRMTPPVHHQAGGAPEACERMGGTREGQSRKRTGQSGRLH